MLLRLAVSLFGENIITLVRLDEDDKLFCISMPFELNIVEEEDGFLLSTELFPQDAKSYVDRMNNFLEQRDSFVRWDIVEFADRPLMAYLRVSFDVDQAKDEIEVGLEELKNIIADFSEEEMVPLDNSECTLNFMWLYQ
tara:strand:+ start:2681 stop:3097 length:417 start_codon:yes stop_codon:yes gene_type:complete